MVERLFLSCSAIYVIGILAIQGLIKLQNTIISSIALILLVILALSLRMRKLKIRVKKEPVFSVKQSIDKEYTDFTDGYYARYFYNRSRG